jgi:uncharacterized membrane protein YeaQ/YmgE (transglycosylase-associated protein family)
MTSMNHAMTLSHSFRAMLPRLATPLAGGLIVMLTGLLGGTAFGADEPGVTESAKATVKEATVAVEGAAKDVKETVKDASRAVGKSFEDLWRRMDEGRLKNRTRDEIVAWVIMGILVGAVAGMLTSLKTTGLGKVGRLLLGLAGAFIGGMVVHVGRVDFGLGPVLIRYEELLCSFVGAIVLIGLARLFRSGARKKPSGGS